MPLIIINCFAVEIQVLYVHKRKIDDVRIKMFFVFFLIFNVVIMV